MSVLIPGMNMTQCCIDCPIYDNEFGRCNIIPDSWFYNRATGEELYDPFEERNKDCPLLEVDKSERLCRRMRLVNADDLKVHVSELMLVYSGSELSDAILNAIDNAESVPQVTVFAENASKEEIEDFSKELENVLERPQGEWKEHKLRNDIVVEYAFKCSNCKKDSGLVYRTDFCPNCGADMRGKKNESGNEL